MTGKYMKFDDKYEILKSYYKEKGHLNIKQNEKYKGYPVGKWLAHFRDTYNGKGNCAALDQKQINSLNSIGMIWGNIKKVNSEKLFQKKYEILKQYLQEKGHLNILRDEEYQGYSIGNWIKQFRDAYKKHGNYIPLSDKQIELLEKLGISLENKKVQEVKQINYNNIPRYFLNYFNNLSIEEVDNKWQGLDVKKNNSKIDFNEIKRVIIIIDKKSKDDSKEKIYKKSYDLYEEVFLSFGITRQKFYKDITDANFDLTTYIRQKIFGFYLQNKGISIDKVKYLFKIYDSFDLLDKNLVTNNYLTIEELDIVKSISFEIEKVIKQIHAINLSFFIKQDSSDMIEDLIKYCILDGNSIKKIYFDYPIKYQHGKYNHNDRVNNKVLFLMRSGPDWNKLPKDYLEEICKRNSISLQEQKLFSVASENYNEVVNFFNNVNEVKYQKVV